MLDEQKIAVPRPVWIALSELWLDTELSPEDLRRIAGVMADSGLGLEELERVCLLEVAPVVSSNLLSMAGVWAGFDEEWLSTQILRNLRERPLRTKFLTWFPVTRRVMLYATRQHWKQLVALVRQLRGRQHG